MNQLIDWDSLLDLVKQIDKTSAIIVGGAPHRNLLTKVKMLFNRKTIYLVETKMPSLEIVLTAIRKIKDRQEKMGYFMAY